MQQLREKYCKRIMKKVGFKDFNQSRYDQNFRLAGGGKNIRMEAFEHNITSFFYDFRQKRLYVSNKWLKLCLRNLQNL